jgi:hypothetical protein
MSDDQRVKAVALIIRDHLGLSAPIGATGSSVVENVSNDMQTAPLRETARAAIAAYHEALESDGWQVVPKVPTETMAQAANDTWPEKGKWMVSDVGRHVYAAMLSAAPTSKGRDGST